MPTGSVQDATVEDHAIAGLHVPTDHTESPGVSADIGYVSFGRGGEIAAIDIGLAIGVQGAEVVLVEHHFAEV